MRIKRLKRILKNFGLLWQALRKFNDDNGFVLSSGIAFNILINLIPFILLLLALVGTYLYNDQEVLNHIRAYLRNVAPTFEEVPLSRRGRVWSCTNGAYQPPEPFVAPDPFVPFTIAAVELEAERMVVLGQVVAGVDVADIKVGQEMELVLDTLYADAESEKLIWKSNPVA